MNVPGRSVRIICDDAWSTEEHEWNVYCDVSYSTVSSELIASYQLCCNLYCIGKSLDRVIGFDFALGSGGVYKVFFFFDNTWTPNAMVKTAGSTVNLLRCKSTKKNMSKTRVA